MELPLELQQLEPVAGAFEILTYLWSKPSGASDDTIMEDLDMSARRFDKAKRRLVTRSYIQMRSDYVYELTARGRESAEIIAEYQSAGGGNVSSGSKIQREVVLAIPRNLIAGQSAPLKVGFEPLEGFRTSADIVVRLSALYADLGEWNEMLRLSEDALVVETSITPQHFNQVRLTLEVMQFSEDGESITECGGMFVDVAVLDKGDTGSLIAYGTSMEFD